MPTKTGQLELFAHSEPTNESGSFFGGHNGSFNAVRSVDLIGNDSQGRRLCSHNATDYKIEITYRELYGPVEQEEATMARQRVLVGLVFASLLGFLDSIYHANGNLFC